MKTRVCQYGLCGKKTTSASGYCKAHKPLPWAAISQGPDGTIVRLYSSERVARRAERAVSRTAQPPCVHVAIFRVASWKPVFKMPGDPTWYDNAQRFATPSEARESAYARFAVWMMPEDYNVHPSPDPVNYRRENGHDAMIAKG